jgi:hypothetical protein
VFVATKTLAYYSEVQITINKVLSPGANNDEVAKVKAIASIWGQSYKTFYICNLQIGQIS